MELIKLYITGIVILVVAILANFLASQLGLKTWYDFFEGMNSGQSLGLKDGLWLFVFYPLFLGGSALLGQFIWKNLF
jgi:hypothetical protein